MKGIAATEVMWAVAGLATLAIVLIFILPKVTAPTYIVYGTEQARTVAQSISSSINALSALDEGSITQALPAEWEINIYEDGGAKYVFVRHYDNVTGKAYTSRIDGRDFIILGDVEPFATAIAASNLLYQKLGPGQPVKVFKVGA